MTRKASLRSFLKTYVVPIFAALLLKIISMSVRWIRNDLTSVKLDLPVIGAFWHGRQLMIAPLFASRKESFPIGMLISSHADGKMIAKAVSWFGIEAIFGSSSQGGKEALIKMNACIKEGISVAFTPDGPRGPARVCKAGVIKLASITGRKIIPVSYGASSFWRFKSWDEMILPKPFSRGVCIAGDAISVPSELSEENFTDYLKRLEEALNALDAKCDTYFNQGN